MRPDNQLTVNVTEAATPDQLDKNNLKQFLTQAQRNLEKAASEAEKAQFAAEIEVYTALEKVVV